MDGRNERERKRNMRSFRKGRQLRTMFDVTPKTDRRTVFNAIVKADNLNPEWFKRGLEEQSPVMSGADEEDVMEIMDVEQPQQQPPNRRKRQRDVLSDDELAAQMDRIKRQSLQDIMNRPEDAKIFINAITLVPENSLPYVGVRDLKDAQFAFQKAAEFLRKFGPRFTEMDPHTGGAMYLNGMNSLKRIEIALTRLLEGDHATDFACKVTVHLGGTTVDDRRNERQLENTQRGPGQIPLLYAEENRHAHFEPFNWKGSRVMDAELLRGPADVPNFMHKLRINIANKITSNSLFTRESSAVRVVSVDSAKLNISYTSQRNLRIGTDPSPQDLQYKRYLNARGIYAMRGGLKDNLCFFRCLVRHQEYSKGNGIPKRVYKSTVFPLFQKYLTKFPAEAEDLQTFRGVQIKNLPILEQLYDVRIYLYIDVNENSTTDTQVKIAPLQSPTLPKSETTTDMHLLLVNKKKHCIYINPTKLNHLTRGGYGCIKCGGVYNRADAYRKHSCRKHVKEIARKLKPYGVPLIFDPKPNPRRQMLQEFGYYKHHETDDYLRRFFVDNYTVDHVTFFDLETIEKEVKTKNGDVIHEQVPFHASIMSTFLEEPINLYNRDPKLLVQSLIDELLRIAQMFKGYMKDKVRYLWNKDDYMSIKNDLWEKHKEKHWGPFPKELQHLLLEEMSISIKDEGIVKTLTPAGKILAKEKEKFMKRFDKVWSPPHTVLGFNSGRFDIPAMRKWGFFSYLKEKDVKDNSKDLFAIKQGACYSQVRSDSLDFKDLMKFLAAGVSFDGACKAFQTETQKMHFCHDWLTSLDQLETTTALPPREAFYNTMKNRELPEEQYQECVAAWEKHQCTTMLDYLRKYNECDVIPGVQLAKKLMEMYASKFKLDCFTDATGAPRLSSDACYNMLNEQIRSQYDGMNNWMRQKMHRKPKPFVPTDLQKRIELYNRQDIAKNRPVTPESQLKPSDIVDIIKQDHYKCHYCYTMLKDGGIQGEACTYESSLNPAIDTEEKQQCKRITYTHWTLDRKSSLLPHTRLNCVACCLSCNRRKKNIGYARFLELEEKRRRDMDCGKRMVNVPADPRVIDALREYKVGGFAASFMLKAEAGITDIDFTYEPKKTVQMVMELDKTSAYPEAMSECMPAGPETYTEDVDVAQFAMQLLQQHPRNFIGFAIVDIEVPPPMCYEPKYQRWPPFQVNTKVPFQSLGKYTQEALQKFKLAKHMERQRRMVSLLKVEKAMFTTEQLRDFVIDRKFKLNKVHATIIYKNAVSFKPFISTLANMRRVADVDKKFEAMGQIAKILMNSLFGRQMMDERRFESIKFMHKVDTKALTKVVNKRQFLEMEQCDEDMYEAHLRQDVRHGINVPMQIGVWILCQSKLKMTQFVYDVLARYWDYQDWNIVGSDTDSFHIATSFPTAKDFFHPSAVRAKHREEYSKLIYGSSDPCKALKIAFSFKEGNPIFCFDRYSKKTPGLFKVEAENKRMYFPCAKTYITVDEKDKVSKTTAKGAQNDRNRFKLTEENFKRLTDDQEQLLVENKHFRYNKKRGQQESIVLVKAAARPINCKRKVLSNGIHTEPLDADMIIEHNNVSIALQQTTP